MKSLPWRALIFSLLFFCTLFATTSFATTLTDIPYGTAKEQKLDIYLPDKAANSPIIFMVHGGAWRFGDKQNRGLVKSKVARWVSRGWAFVSINYRMLPNTAPDQQAVDVAKALAYVQTHSAKWAADSSKIIVMGHSAGAHLVSLLVTDPSLSDSKTLAPIQGAILLDTAALDVSRLMTQKHARLYDRAFGDNPIYWRKVSAIEHLHNKVKPVLLVCSTQREDSCEQANYFVNKALKLGVKAQQLRIDLSHSKINTSLGDNNLYTDQIEDFIRTLDPYFNAYLQTRAR
ncbi:alpha/beta hydrolase [Zhongshania arctica]|uniref:Alpha/beta hydrolase n=1 Tax=Zhongshania arctica TaxID=3238302 RepID=A0ABV3TT44_9GAMM